jgi:predicted kinase
VPTLLHLNGPSGVGKSTLARAHAASHPGTLVCDIDELRSWVSGWEDDFVGTGEAVRQTALALMTAYLHTGRDVVLPQLIVTPAQAERFKAAAAEAGATYACVVLDVTPDVLLDRLHHRIETPAPRSSRGSSRSAGATSSSSRDGSSCSASRRSTAGQSWTRPTPRRRWSSSRRSCGPDLR